MFDLSLLQDKLEQHTPQFKQDYIEEFEKDFVGGHDGYEEGY